MLQALASVYDVTVITWQPFDLQSLDGWFGTHLAGNHFAVWTPSWWERRAVSFIPDNSIHQKSNYLSRIVKRERDGFTAVVACTFEGDYGPPALQYIHYPYLGQRYTIWNVSGDAPLWTSLVALIHGKQRPWMWISGYSFDRMRANVTLTNSDWTREVIAREVGTNSLVLYPPAAGDFDNKPWEEREDAFVAIGRLFPDKRQDWIIETLARVQPEWPGLKLHVCGASHDDEYVRRLEGLAEKYSSWVTLHKGPSRVDILGLLANSRYGIHAYKDEHFGIAPAEMARAGCIPFVHNSGGQIEIVDGNPHLCYTTTDDAIAKILEVLRNPVLQRELRNFVYTRSERFSPNTFMGNFLGFVSSFIASQPTPGNKPVG